MVASDTYVCDMSGGVVSRKPLLSSGNAERTVCLPGKNPVGLRDQLNTKTAPGRRRSTSGIPGPHSTPCSAKSKEVKLTVSISGSGASAHSDTPTSLYLYYDKFNVLLYVGITARGIRRNHEHAETQPWWRYVAHQEVTHLPSRRAALRVERETIIRRSPPFNRTHNPGHEELAAAYHRFHARAEEQRRTDAEVSAVTVETPRKVKNPLPQTMQLPKSVPPVVPARPALALPSLTKCALVHLDLISRDGKFLRCHSRVADAALTNTINLMATRFVRFKAGEKVGSVMSLSRGNHGIEMVLKGVWLSSVTAVTAVVHLGERQILTLELTIGGKSWLATPIETSGPGKANLGKFSNGPLSRRLGSSQGGAA